MAKKRDKVEIDTKDLNEAGFDQYNTKERWFPVTSSGYETGRRAQKAVNIVGGTLGKQAKLEIGSDKFRLDAERQHLVVNDGVHNRVLIGKRLDGTYGIDVSKPGFDVFTANRADLWLDSREPTDYQEYDASKFAYSTQIGTPVAFPEYRITVDASYDTLEIFQLGDKIKVTQAGVDLYFYITEVGSGYINLAGDSLSNAPFTLFGRSRLANPSGHPGTFTISDSHVNLQHTTPGATLTTSTKSMSWWMEGASLNLTYNFFGSITGSGIVSIYLNFPFNLSEGETAITTLSTHFFGQNNTAYISGYQLPCGVALDLNNVYTGWKMVLTVEDGAGASSWEVGNLQGSFIYRVQLV